MKPPCPECGLEKGHAAECLSQPPSAELVRALRVAFANCLKASEWRLGEIWRLQKEAAYWRGKYFSTTGAKRVVNRVRELTHVKR